MNKKEQLVALADAMDAGSKMSQQCFGRMVEIPTMPDSSLQEGQCASCALGAIWLGLGNKPERIGEGGAFIAIELRERFPILDETIADGDGEDDFIDTIIRWNDSYSINREDIANRLRTEANVVEEAGA